MNLIVCVTGWSEIQIKTFVMFSKIKKYILIQQKIYTEFMEGTEKLCGDCRKRSTHGRSYEILPVVLMINFDISHKTIHVMHYLLQSTEKLCDNCRK